MKIAIIGCILASAFVLAHSQGIPIANCEPGEHSVLYCPQVNEPSCDDPTFQERPGACDIPQCFCNRPTIRNTRNNKCVLPLDCPRN